VPDLEEAARLYETSLGMSRGLHRVLPERGVEVQFMHLPGSTIELLAPVGENSTVARFLERRGAGLHHLSYEVQDIEGTLAALAARGVELIDASPRPGAEGKRVAFLHPRSAGGVLIEIQEA